MALLSFGVTEKKNVQDLWEINMHWRCTQTPHTACRSLLAGEKVLEALGTQKAAGREGEAKNSSPHSEFPSNKLIVRLAGQDCSPPMPA